MRLGGPLFEKPGTPDQWVAAVKAHGYRATFCPVGQDSSDELIRAYVSVAKENDILIAETGSWSNPLSTDAAERNAALQKCKNGLALADAIGAGCCVNISGSRGEKWDGPCADDLTEETFDMIVESVRQIIDDVKPTRACYTLETMPWMYPDSVDSYLALLDAIDRPSFAVHFDPVNLICSPQRYFNNTEIISNFVARLGVNIKSTHAKDILLGDRLTVNLEEVRPGLGQLDYRTFLRELSKLPQEVPVMLEHLTGAEEYAAAAEHIRGVAASESIDL
jgi:sugar phosphate isomerase/epimerase